MTVLLTVFAFASPLRVEMQTEREEKSQFIFFDLLRQPVSVSNETTLHKYRASGPPTMNAFMLFLCVAELARIVAAVIKKPFMGIKNKNDAMPPCIHAPPAV